MALPLYSTPQIERIQDLLLRLAEGNLLVPRFQRNFVWKDEQRQGLFRSIYRGLPVGSIFTWATSEHELASFERIGGLRVGKPKPNQPRTYLLDGHQRMAALLMALGPGLVTEDQGSESQRPSDDPWESPRPLYFDLENQEFELEPRSKSVPSHWVSLSDLFTLVPFYAKQRELSQGGTENLARRLEYLASVFKDYRIPVVPLVSEDLELVTEGFRLINSAGTRMSLFHMVNALTWKPDFDLSNLAAEILGSLDPGWQDLDEDVLLRVCKAILDLDLFENDATRVAVALGKGNRAEVIQQARTALDRALRFLDQELSIRSTQLLPYANQVVLLAEALRFEPDDVPSTSLREALRTWFWVTSYTEHFGGVSAGRMSRALKQIRRLRAGEAVPIAVELAAGPVEPVSRFNLNTARSRASLWRLAEFKRRVSTSEDYDPFELLAREAKASLLRLSPIQGRGAEGIEHRALLPSEDHDSFRQKLQLGLLSETEMAAHGIDSDAVTAFALGDFEEFFRRRRRILIEDEAKFVRSLGLEYRLPA